MAKDDAAVGAMRDGFLSELPHDGIRGTTTLWQGGSFVSYDLSTPVYRVGDVPLTDRLALTLPEYPWAIAGTLLVVCIVLSMWMQVALAARIRRRLMGAPQFEENLDGGGAL